MTRVSHERAALDALERAIGELPGVTSRRGFAADNRLAIESWELNRNQAFQYGDLRLEAPNATVVLEVESAGGVTNLVKYWPLLATRRDTKRFVLAHVFRIQSTGDYIAHRRLWAFLLDEIRVALEKHHGVIWQRDWYAEAFTYRADAIDLDEVGAFLRDACCR